MKIVLVTDTHVKAAGGKIRGVDPVARLKLCVSTINKIAADADLCVMLGDNVDTPSEEEYRLFLECLEDLNMPIRFLIGNHDDREMFLRVKPDLPVDENGFVQSSISTSGVKLLFLDTGAGPHAGDYTGLKLQWLKKELQDAGTTPVYIFMHHPPFDTGFWNDYSKVTNSEELLSVLHHSGNVRHVFFGHTHRASSGNWREITWTTLHGTCYENDYELLPAKPNYRGGPAQIGILLINGEESVVHYLDALDPYPLIGYSGKSIREPETRENEQA